MKNTIEFVRIFESKSNYHNGEDIGAGFAVIVDPLPATGRQKWQIAQKIRDCLDGIVLEDE